MVERLTRVQENIQNIITNAMISGGAVTIQSFAEIVSLIAQSIDQELDNLVQQFNNELENIRSELRELS